MLDVINVSKSFKDKEILRGISFHIVRGEIVSLIGNNGSGKTTTFRLLLNLLQPDSGTISLDYKKIEIENVSYLPEERSVYHDCTVYEYLYHICRLCGLSKKDSNDRIDYWLEYCKIEEYRNKLTSLLSKGNQQKVAIIATIIKDCELVIMDEPFTGLDRDNIEILLDIIRKLSKQNKIVIISSHIYHPINHICNRYLFLKDGKIGINVTKTELENDPRKVVSIKKNIDYQGEVSSVIPTSNGYKYYFNENNSAQKFVEYLSNNNYDYSISHIQIEDLLDL